MKCYVKNATVYGDFLSRPIVRTVYEIEDGKCVVKINKKDYQVVCENGVWKVLNCI